MGDDLLRIRVECYAGHRGEETPRVIELGDRRIEVAAITDQWLAPDHRYFKFADPAGDTYIVRHDVMSGHWELTMYGRGGSDGQDEGGADG
jgi:hypothetical protein